MKFVMAAVDHFGLAGGELFDHHEGPLVMGTLRRH